MDKDLKALQELYPDLPELFLENLHSRVLCDTSWVNNAFEKYQTNLHPSPCIQTADPGYWAALMTLNEIFTCSELEYDDNNEEEPTKIIITAYPDYGS